MAEVLLFVAVAVFVAVSVAIVLVPTVLERESWSRSLLDRDER